MLVYISDWRRLCDKTPCNFKLTSQKPPRSYLIYHTEDIETLHTYFKNKDGSYTSKVNTFIFLEISVNTTKRSRILSQVRAKGRHLLICVTPHSLFIPNFLPIFVYSSSPTQLSVFMLTSNLYLHYHFQKYHRHHAVICWCGGCCLRHNCDAAMTVNCFPRNSTSY